MRKNILCVIVLCLIIGSLYSRMLLSQNMVKVDEHGQIFQLNDQCSYEDIPVEIKFRFLP